MQTIALARQLAALADVDIRSAKKALRDGPQAVRGRPGERIAAAMPSLGIADPSTPHATAKAAA